LIARPSIRITKPVKIFSFSTIDAKDTMHAMPKKRVYGMNSGAIHETSTSCLRSTKRL
jgi:hypothetical protein